MKRVFHHPPEPSNGTKYWRSIGELKDTPEFRQWLEHEFPEGRGGTEWRRMVAARFCEIDGRFDGARRSWPNELSSPRIASRPVHEKCGVDDSRQIPLLRDRNAATHRRRFRLIATTVDGRPIKLDGNPLHPASGGTTDTFVQASILDLYDPTRSKRFVQKGKASRGKNLRSSSENLAKPS